MTQTTDSQGPQPHAQGASDGAAVFKPWSTLPKSNRLEQALRTGLLHHSGLQPHAASDAQEIARLVAQELENRDALRRRSSCLDWNDAALQRTLSARLGTFGTVTVHISPDAGGAAMTVPVWVAAVQDLMARIHHIEPRAVLRIDTTGLGAMHYQAARAAGVEVGRFVQCADDSWLRDVIPAGMIPSAPSGLPPRHVVL